MIVISVLSVDDVDIGSIIKENTIKKKKLYHLSVVLDGQKKPPPELDPPKAATPNT